MAQLIMLILLTAQPILYQGVFAMVHTLTISKPIWPYFNPTRMYLQEYVLTHLNLVFNQL